MLATVLPLIKRHFKPLHSARLVAVGGGDDTREWLDVMHSMYSSLLSHNGGGNDSLYPVDEASSYLLAAEAGTHRFIRQRSGKRQTSYISFIASEYETSDMDEQPLFRLEDVKFQTHKSSGAGGQHVNTTDSAVRAVHLPTSLSVVCSDERSQHRNRAKALERLNRRVEEERAAATLATEHRLRLTRKQQEIGAYIRTLQVQPSCYLLDHSSGLRWVGRRAMAVARGDADEFFAFLLESWQRRQSAGG